jgi:hypothetical protein
LDVKDGKDIESQPVIVGKKNSGANQRWKILYTDKATVAKKGLDDDFGFQINRPFYVMSRMPHGRALEASGSTVRINSWQMGRTVQQWVFTEKRVISPVTRRTTAIEQPNGGRNNLRLYNSINSRWW